MKEMVVDTPQQGGAQIADAIVVLLASKPDALLCLAAGHSSLPVFEQLVAAKKRGADFSRARFVGLDEWLGVPPDSEGSCHSFLHRNLFGPLGIKEEQICLFNSLCDDPEAECGRIETHIDRCGGIDFMLLGLGLNGHLALNEPGASFELGAHVAPLSQTTKEVAPKYFSGEMPPLTHGLTLGIRNILAARSIYLGVFGAHKRQVVQALRDGAVTEQMPASALKNCPHALLVLDREALPQT